MFNNHVGGLQRTHPDSRTQLITRLTAHSLDLLVKYPSWRTAVFEAYSQGSIPGNYEPQIIEFFDHQGLLASQVAGYVFNPSVPIEHKSEFLAIYFDSELVVFTANQEVIINRLGIVSVFGSFDLGG